MDPCGTPSTRGSGIDVFPDTIHVCERSLKYDLNHRIVWSLVKLIDNLDSGMS